MPTKTFAIPAGQSLRITIETIPAKPRKRKRKAKPIGYERSPSGFVVTTVLGEEQPIPALAARANRYTERPAVGSTEWKERHLVASVLAQSPNTRAAAGRLGMSLGTLREWRRIGRTMYAPRLGDQADPVTPPAQYGRERRLIAVAICAYGGDLAQAAAALDWDVNELRDKMAFYGLQVGTRK
jgi:hypothetical protein